MGNNNPSSRNNQVAIRNSSPDTLSSNSRVHTRRNGFSFVAQWLYFSLLTSKYGGTLGKMAVGLRVVDDHGMYPTFGRATGRFFSKIISGCILFIGYILAGFNPQKRALHDSIAGTFVVRKEYARQQQPNQ